MLQVTPQMRILVAVEPADFRKGIDGFVQLCKTAYAAHPFSGTVFVFRNRNKTAIKALVYDGQGFWLCHKRLSKGRFTYWPEGKSALQACEAHELLLFLRGGDPREAKTAPVWKKVVA